MPTVQNLKKKLQVINSTKKLTQAMKTASTVKFSRLSGLYGEYEKYESRYNRLYESYRGEFNSVFSAADCNAPVCYVLMTSDKGMCGAFNSETMSFFERKLSEEKKPPLVICCGKKGSDYCENKGISCEKAFFFPDIPVYDNAAELFEEIKRILNQGRASEIKIVYPRYTNMIKQTPVCCNLFDFGGNESKGEAPLFVPDRETVIKNTAEKIFLCSVYRKLLETALGAHAATLTTMRSAYDTACEYSAQLETEINRKRQSQVTADVIEISSEYSMKGDAW